MKVKVKKLEDIKSALSLCDESGTYDYGDTFVASVEYLKGLADREFDIDNEHIVVRGGNQDNFAISTMPKCIFENNAEKLDSIHDNPFNFITKPTITGEPHIEPADTFKFLKELPTVIVIGGVEYRLILKEISK